MDGCCAKMVRILDGMHVLVLEHRTIIFKFR